MIGLHRFVTTLLFVAAANGVQAQGQVLLEGRVRQPGPHVVQPGARLLDAIPSGSIAADAYLLGAAWLHRGAIDEQQARKAGVLFELGVLESTARLHGNGARASLAARLAAQLRAMPVTGRRVNTLDPVRLELEPATNRPLAAGDRLIFPPRPASVTVSGAVMADCALSFAPLRTADAYLADCPRHPEADTDWLYIVQPDGQVLRRGIAAWNRESGRLPAPGARVLVPLREGRYKGGIAEGIEGGMRQLNDELAAFLATQPLPTHEAAQ